MPFALTATLVTASLPAVVSLITLVAAGHNRLPYLARSFPLSLSYLGGAYALYALVSGWLLPTLVSAISVLYVLFIGMLNKAFRKSFRETSLNGLSRGLDIILGFIFVAFPFLVVIGIIGFIVFGLFKGVTSADSGDKGAEKPSSSSSNPDNPDLPDYPNKIDLGLNAAEVSNDYYHALASDNYERACQDVDPNILTKWEKENLSCSSILRYAYPEGNNEYLIAYDADPKSVITTSDKDYVSLPSQTLQKPSDKEVKVEAVKIAVIPETNILLRAFNGVEVYYYVASPLPKGVEIPRNAR